MVAESRSYRALLLLAISCQAEQAQVVGSELSCFAAVAPPASRTTLFGLPNSKQRLRLGDGFAAAMASQQSADADPHAEQAQLFSIDAEGTGAGRIVSEVRAHTRNGKHAASTRTANSRAYMFSVLRAC